MTQRPDVDETQLEQMRRTSAAAAACPRCPALTRRTTRRTADSQLEVRCAGCGGVLSAGPGESARNLRDLPS